MPALSVSILERDSPGSNDIQGRRDAIVHPSFPLENTCRFYYEKKHGFGRRIPITYRTDRRIKRELVKAFSHKLSLLFRFIFIIADKDDFHLFSQLHAL